MPKKGKWGGEEAKERRKGMEILTSRDGEEDRVVLRIWRIMVMEMRRARWSGWLK